MIAVVLVGGKGTRLRPLTLSCPKPMLPIAGVPMLERVLAYLKGHGVTRAVLSLGYQPDAFLRAYPDDVIAGLPVSYAIESQPLDTGGGIAFAAASAGIEEAFLAVNGDILTDADLGALIDFHRAGDALATIGLTPVEDPSAYGVVVTEEPRQGKVVSFIEKPPRQEAPTNMINAGIYVLEPEVFAGLQPSSAVSIERTIFPDLARRGRLLAMSSPAYWIDTGTPAKYLEAQMDLLHGRRGDQLALGAVESRPGIHELGPTQLWGECKSPVLAGVGASSAPTALVSSSILGSRVTVGPTARVVGSVVLDGAVIEAGAVVEDSIIGPGARVLTGVRVEGPVIVGPDAVVSDLVSGRGELSDRG